jgi:hypothetical protein
MLEGLNEDGIYKRFMKLYKINEEIVQAENTTRNVVMQSMRVNL